MQQWTYLKENFVWIQFSTQWDIVIANLSDALGSLAFKPLWTKWWPV